MMIPLVILAIETDSDREYMTLLYRNHRALMLKTAWRYTRSPADAEDIVSDSCAALIDKLDTLRQLDAGALRAYVATTVRNHAIDLCRRQQRSNGLFREYDEAAEAVAAPEQVEEKILLREEVRRVRAALEQLPEHERDILRLRYRQGLSDREIAEAVGLSESSIRKYISRARKRLKAMLYEGGVE